MRPSSLRRPDALRSASAALGALVVIALLAGCGGGDAPAGTAAARPSASAGTATTTTTTPADRTPVASAGCSVGVTPTSLERRTVAVAELERWYLITVPSSARPGAPLPLVVDLHGFTEGADAHAAMTGMGDAAERHGFVAVVPQGTGAPTRWAAGPAGSAAGPNPDLDFANALLDQVERAACIDLGRVYVIGLSNGAMLASLLACRLADRIAAVAPISGVVAYDDCSPAAPVPMLTIHGTADPILHFNGGVGDLVRVAAGGGRTAASATSTTSSAPATSAAPDLNGPGYPAAVAAWAERNGCDPVPEEADVSATVLHRTYDCPTGEDVEMYIVRGGGHAWPGSELSRGLAGLLGPTTFDIDATELAWSFVSRFHRDI